MPPRRRRAVLAVLLLVMLIAACFILPRFDWRVSRAEDVWALEASGVIQATEVLVASEYGGRIASIPVSEGDTVSTGDILVQLDTMLLDAQISAAQAAIALAEASVAQARAGARPGQIAVAKAKLARAKEGRVAAMQAVSDTMILVQNPQDIHLQIAVLQAQIRASDHQLAQALARKDAAEIGKDQFEEAVKQLDKLGGPGKHRVKVKIAEGSLDGLRDRIPPECHHLLPGVLHDGVYTCREFEIHIQGDRYTLYKWVTVNVNLPFESHLAPNTWWQAWVGVNATAAQKAGLEALLNQLYEKRAHPQDLEAKVDEAIAALAQSEARVAAAQARLDALQAGATPEQVAALQARVAQAQTVLDSLMTRRSMMQITAPMDGVVMDVSVHSGEVAASGATLLTIADLAGTRLTVYLPETQLGHVSLGHAVQVRVDSFPGRVFRGRVAYIADRAEFTPRNVATKEERVNLVFAIEVRLPNEDGALKPGMPADAVFGE